MWCFLSSSLRRFFASTRSFVLFSIVYVCNANRYHRLFYFPRFFRLEFWQFVFSLLFSVFSMTFAVVLQVINDIFCVQMTSVVGNYGRHRIFLASDKINWICHLSLAYLQLRFAFAHYVCVGGGKKNEKTRMQRTMCLPHVSLCRKLRRRNLMLSYASKVEYFPSLIRCKLAEYLPALHCSVHARCSPVSIMQMHPLSTYFNVSFSASDVRPFLPMWHVVHSSSKTRNERVPLKHQNRFLPLQWN